MADKSYKSTLFKRAIDLGKITVGIDTDLVKVWRTSTGEEKAISLGDIAGGLIGDYVPYTGAVTNVNLGEYGLSTGYIKFDTTPTNTPLLQGTLAWAGNRSTLGLIMNGTLQYVGQNLFLYVKNSTGSTISKGTNVGFVGTDGASGHVLISKFLANGSSPSTYYIGVTSEEIGNGEFGQVMVFGELSGFNTSGYSAGALLYASTTVAGGFQTTVPQAPNNIILVCATINSKNNGDIIIRPTIGSNINNDEGVKITSPTTGDLLQLQASGLWENRTKAQILGGTSSQFVKGDGSLDSTAYQPTSEKGQPSGYASLDSNGKVPLTQINDALLGNVNYQGLWNASTNTPTLANPPASATKGHYYITNVAGTQFGISFEIGDWIISNGSSWSKVDNTDAVSSVFGRTGNVTASEADYQSYYPRLSQTYNNPSWINQLAWSKITGTPTTLGGYGITDAYTQNQVNSLLGGYLPLGGGTLTGPLQGTSSAFSGNVTWSSNQSGNPRAVAIGWSGNEYGQIGYGISFTGTAGVHNYAINDIVSRVEFSNGINVYAANAGAIGTQITWTTVFEARRNAFSYMGNTVWHSGNDGSGSGLDADTVDGFHETAFAVNQRGGEIGDNTGINDNTRRNGMYRVNSGVTSSPDSSKFWALNVYGNQFNVVAQLATDFNSGESYVRGYNASWSSWRRMWDSLNLSNPVTGTGNTNYLAKFTSNGSTIGNSAVFESSGNVGIGTNNPSVNLHLKSASGSTIFRIEDSAGVAVGRIQANASDGNINFFEQSGYSLTFGTSNTERMRIFSGGNVHIGSTPSSDNGARLQVSGDVTVAGNIILDSSAGRFVGFGTSTTKPFIEFNTLDNITINAKANGLIEFELNGVQVGRFNNSEMYAKSILTNSTTNRTAKNWKLGDARTDTIPNANRLIRVEIDGVEYDILCRQVI